MLRFCRSGDGPPAIRISWYGVCSSSAVMPSMICGWNGDETSK